MSTDAANKRVQLVQLVKTKFKFRNVSEQEIISMLSTAQFVTFRRGDYVLQSEDRVNYLYFILSGTVEAALLTSLENRKVLATLGPGDDFPLPTLITSYTLGRPSFGEFLCLTDCELALIPAVDVMERVLVMPGISAAYMEMMAMMISELASEFVIKKAEEKLAAYLCYLIREHGVFDDGSVRIPRLNSVQKIADILSLTRETTHRIFMGFEKSGFIKMEKKFIVVLDEQALRDLSGNIDCLMGFYGSVPR